MAARKPYPWFYAVNDRPVQFTQLPSGELDVLVYDPASGALRSDLSYLSAPFDPGRDVEELSEGEFWRRLAVLRERLLRAPRG